MGVWRVEDAMRVGVVSEAASLSEFVEKVAARGVSGPSS